MENKDKEREREEREKEREEKESIKNRILELKSEVFDLIRQQEMLVAQNNDIQNSKLQKVQDIQKLESSLI